jgi:sialic acid synthase SpsE
MRTLDERFGLPVGYSDHTEGTAVATAAVARGARVIEKHLTLDRTLPGPDHAASLDPVGFRTLVDAVRTVQQALGNPDKAPDPAELEVREVARRSLVTTDVLSQDRPIRSQDLIALRPGGGLPPGALWDWIGRAPSRDYGPGEVFEG